MKTDLSGWNPPLRQQQAIFGAIFALFWIGILLPQGAVSSALLAYQRGKSICAVRGCWHPTEVKVTFHKTDKPALGSDEVLVGLCAAHAANPPADLTMDNMAWGQSMCAFGLLCVAGYVGASVPRFPRDDSAPRPMSSREEANITVRFQPEEEPPPPPSAGRKLWNYFLVTAAVVVGFDAAFWVMARYM